MIVRTPPGGLLGRAVTVVSDLSVRARRRYRGTATLGRPAVSVGNLAFGGRGKTPIVASLAAHATAEGLGVAILTRGYGGAITDPPVLAVGGVSPLPPWCAPVTVAGETRAAFEWTSLLGDEAPWLAASAPGALVVVDGDRARGAASVRHRVDLFLLDDGAQCPVARDVDLLCVDPLLDPPWSLNPVAQRESYSRLDRADRVVAITHDSLQNVSRVSDVLRRTHGGLWTLGGDPATVPKSVILLAGVGNPRSVESLLLAAGVESVCTLPLADHASPTEGMLARARGHNLPLVSTEKDAVRWAAALGSELPGALVLKQRLEGVDALWCAVRGGLMLC